MALGKVGLGVWMWGSIGGGSPRRRRGHCTSGQRDPHFLPVSEGATEADLGGSPLWKEAPPAVSLPPGPDPPATLTFLDSAPREHSSRFCSSSDSDYDDEDPPKFYIRIKPIQPPERVGSAATSAATEQLKASVGSLILPPCVGVSGTRDTRGAPFPPPSLRILEEGPEAAPHRATVAAVALHS